MDRQLSSFIERNTKTPESFLHLYCRSVAVVQAIAVATRLNLPALTRGQFVPVSELALRCEANEENLRRLVAALTTIGIFELVNDSVKLSEAAACLDPKHPGTVASVPILSSYDWAFVPWGYLYDCVKTGETAFNKAYGMGLFDYLPQQPQAAEQFNRGMADQVEFAKQISDAFDFTSVSELVDLGGGIGGVMRAILSTYPNLQGRIFDLAAHQQQAETLIGEDGFSERCSFTAGSFFDGVPASECYLLRYILHDWSDGNVRRILANCRAALKPGGVILVADEQLDEQMPGSFLDLNMMVFTGGKERSLKELADLAASVGLRVVSNMPLSRSNHLTVLRSDDCV